MVFFNEESFSCRNWCRLQRVYDLTPRHTRLFCVSRECWASAIRWLNACYSVCHSDADKRLIFDKKANVGCVLARTFSTGSKAGDASPPTRCVKSRTLPKARPRPVGCVLARTLFSGHRCVTSRTLPQIPMDRRIGPIFRPFDQPMLYRIVPAIADVGRHVALIADVMLPKTPLPYPTLLPLNMARAQSSDRQPSGKTRFYQPPPGGKIAVACRQGPDTMQVIGQDHPSVDLKRSLGSGDGNRLTQALNLLDQQATPSVLQGDREKDGGPHGPWADVI